MSKARKAEERKRVLLLRNNIISMYLLYKRIDNPRREWVRSIFQERSNYSVHETLLPTLRDKYPELFFNYTRMSGEQYDHLLSLLQDKLQKQRTQFRKSISASERLSICLRFLASGINYTDLAYAFRVSKSSICHIIPETCDTIWQILQPLVMDIPSSSAEWTAIAEGFEYKWNFPNCIGAIDGKHIEIQAPPSAGSTYYNYKGYNSIVLMAVADANYNFIYVDSGNYGRISDGGIFNNCSLGKALANETLSSLPNPAPLSNSELILPFVFVGDEAFPLKRNILCPYPGKLLSNERRIFNYRLSRARNCIENAFGILASRWRVLRTEITLKPEHANKVILACCCLHNYLMKSEMGKASKKYCPLNYADSLLSDTSVREGAWRREDFTLRSLRHQGSNNASQAASAVRDEFCMYFSTEGAVSWQDKVISVL